MEVLFCFEQKVMRYIKGELVKKNTKRSVSKFLNVLSSQALKTAVLSSQAL